MSHLLHEFMTGKTPDRIVQLERAHLRIGRALVAAGFLSAALLAYLII